MMLFLQMLGIHDAADCVSGIPGFTQFRLCQNGTMVIVKSFIKVAAYVVLLVGASSLCSCKGVSGQREVASSPQPAGDGLASAGGQYIVIYKPDPNPIPLNEPFNIEVQVLDAKSRKPLQNGFKLDVDGRMPHHRHGMNRQPTLQQREDGTSLVQGMLFHMPGRWEVYFDITRDGRTERAQDVIFLD
jgi:hypothetical protein